MTVEQRRRMNRRKYLNQKRRKRREKLQRSIDHWVYGKEVTGPIYTKRQYENMVRIKVRSTIVKPRKTSESQQKCYETYLKKKAARDNRSRAALQRWERERARKLEETK